MAECFLELVRGSIDKKVLFCTDDRKESFTGAGSGH